MKKLVTMAALLGLMLVLAAPAMAQGDDTPNCKPGDVLESGLCDPHSGPNSAIQGAPGTASPSSSASAPANDPAPDSSGLVMRLDNSDCDKFPSQEAAQAFLDSPNFPGAVGGGDVDADGDGVACDEFFAASSASASASATPTASASASPSASASASPSSSASVSATPEVTLSSSAGAEQLPNTGGTSLLALASFAGATILIFGVGSALLLRR